MKITSLSLVIATAALSAGSLAMADSISLTPNHDNTLFDGGDLSSGAGEWLFAGTTNSGLRRRALMSFDLSSLPAGAVINSVSLRVVCDQVSRTGVTNLYTLHKVSASWGEGASNSSSSGAGTDAAPGDATWAHRSFSSVLWTTPGGDFAPTASAGTVLTGTGTYSFSDAGMAADVQAWLANPSSNFGWLMKSNESGGGHGRRFISREAATSEVPTLVIDYTVVPAPATALFGLMGLAGASRRRR